MPTNPDNLAPQTPHVPWYKRKLFTYTRDFAIIVVIFSIVGLYQTRDHPKSNSDAPTWQLNAMDNTTHSLEQYKGKKTLIYFWAPWCTVCHLQADNIQRVQKRFGDQFQVVSIALSYQNRKRVQEYIDKHDVTFPVLLGNKSLNKAYRVGAFPTIYVLDKNLKVEHTMVGYTTTAGLLTRLAL